MAREDQNVGVIILSGEGKEAFCAGGDQKIRGEGVLRTVYLYPLALSFIVTGTAWKWILNPTLGIEKLFFERMENGT